MTETRHGHAYPGVLNMGVSRNKGSKVDLMMTYREDDDDDDEDDDDNNAISEVRV